MCCLRPSKEAKEVRLEALIQPKVELLTNLLDAFLVLNEKLDPGDVNVEAGPMWGSFHRGVKAPVVFTGKEQKQNNKKVRRAETSN